MHHHTLQFATLSLALPCLVQGELGVVELLDSFPKRVGIQTRVVLECVI